MTEVSSFQPTSPEQQRADKLAELGIFNPREAGIIATGQWPQTKREPREPRPPRSYPKRGSVYDFTGRADEFRGGPGAPDAAHQTIYEKGIATTRAVLRETRIQDIPTNPVKNAELTEVVDNAGRANQANGAVRVFVEDDPADPRRARLGKYRDAEHAQELEEAYELGARKHLAEACGSCALRMSCSLKQDFLNVLREEPKARKGLREAIQTSEQTGTDYSCENVVWKARGGKLPPPDKI